MNHSDCETVFPNVFPYAERQKPGTIPSASDKSLRLDLLGHLLKLPYRTFLLVVAQLLERQGSQEVHLMGRDGFVGRNRGGGWDLEATLPPSQCFAYGQPGVRCIIQVKQFTDLAVQQRTVDELRGCCLRAGAGRGLLITTTRFSPVAQRAAAASALAPITLIDGEMLVNLLVRQEMGILQSKSGKRQLDLEYFQSLSAKADALPSGAAQPPTFVKHQVRKDKDTGSPDSQVSVVAKENQRQQTVLHFSVTLGAGGSGSRKRTQAK